MTKRLNSWLSRDEVARVLSCVDDTTSIGLRDLVVLRLGFSIGLRRAEITGINWGDITWPDKLRLVGKGGKAATVTITRNTRRAIDQWAYSWDWEDLSPLVTSFTAMEGRTYHPRPTGKRLSTNAVRDITMRYSNLSGIKFAPHDMRRTFAGLLFEETGSIETVSAALRHSNVGTTQRYLEQRQDAAAQAVEKAGFDI